jgi:hypothetical protein
MAILSKQALVVENNSSFPDNSTGAITAYGLRNYNTDIIDSMVDELTFVPFTASVNVSISNLNQFTASQQPTFVSLNAFTASQLTINTGINSFTQSATGRLNNLESTTSSLNAWSQSINEIIVNGTSIGTSTRFYFNGYASASIVPNVNGAIASITILADQTFTPSASFNAYTASTNAWTASAKIQLTNLQSTTASLNTSVSNINSFTASTITSLNSLNAFTASLDATYATDAQLNYSASVLQANIDTKLNTSSFNTFSSSVATSFSSSTGTINQFTASQLTINAGYNSYTSSNNTKWTTLGNLTGSYATTGSNNFIGNQTITGSLTITGSAYNSVISASIASSTASLDFSKGNMFTLTLPATVKTNINIQNITPGQTAMLRIRTAGTSASASFSTNVYQPNSAYYVPTSTSGSEDILTFSSFDSTKAYLVSVLNMTNN